MDAPYYFLAHTSVSVITLSDDIQLQARLNCEVIFRVRISDNNKYTTYTSIARGAPRIGIQLRNLSNSHVHVLGTPYYQYM